jgi:hypothetical protein
MQVVDGLRAMIGVRRGFVDSLLAQKTMRLRRQIAANSTTALARPETPMGAAASAANDLWRHFAAALASDPRAGLALR